MNKYEISIFGRSFYSNPGIGKEKYLRRRHERKGPKGYKRASTSIREEACEILYWDTEVDATDIDISVSDGTIFLKGSVESRQDKRRVEVLLEDISGVTDIQNHLTIKPLTNMDESASGNASGEVAPDTTHH